MMPKPTEVLAIDPGPTTCGVVFYVPAIRGVSAAQAAMTSIGAIHLARTAEEDISRVVIEDYVPQGQATGHDTIETCKLIGRLEEAARERCTLISRPTVRRKLCPDAGRKVGDPQIRAALLGLFCRWHEMDEKAVKGTKKQPGPLYGVSSHAWSALALAVVYAHGEDL